MASVHTQERSQQTCSSFISSSITQNELVRLVFPAATYDAGRSTGSIINTMSTYLYSSCYSEGVEIACWEMWCLGEKPADWGKKTSEGFSRVNANLIRFLRLCGQMHIIINVVSLRRRARAAAKSENQCVISDFISYLSPVRLFPQIIMRLGL